jgi:hypothetical protein
MLTAVREAMQPCRRIHGREHYQVRAVSGSSSNFVSGSMDRSEVRPRDWH